MSADPSGTTGHLIGDKSARQRFLLRSVWFTVPGTFVVLGAAYALLPPLAGMEDANQRLVLALRWLPIALLPYVAVCLVIATARFLEGSHNPLAGTETERLRTHCRVMQNTLEQFVWFAACLLPLATFLTPAQSRFVPIATTFFAFARFVYWWGYLRSGSLGRAPGVQLTFCLNIFLLVLVLVHFTTRVLA